MQALAQELGGFGEQRRMPGQVCVLDVETGDLGRHAGGDQRRGVGFGFAVEDVAFGGRQVGWRQVVQAPRGERRGDALSVFRPQSGFWDLSVC